jgi:hypothetical protein
LIVAGERPRRSAICAIYQAARANGHTKREARRILKRHLSNVIYRRMIRDLAAHPAQPPIAA